MTILSRDLSQEPGRIRIEADPQHTKRTRKAWRPRLCAISRRMRVGTVS